MADRESVELALEVYEQPEYGPHHPGRILAEEVRRLEAVIERMKNAEHKTRVL